MSTDFIRQLAAAGASAPSADNCQPWRLDWDGSELTVRYVQRSETHGVFGPSSHATLLSVGAVVENLDATLAANGMPAAWRWGDGSGAPYASVAIAHVPAQFSVPEGPLARHTNRLAFRGTPLPGALAGSIDGRGEGANRLALLPGKAEKARLVRLVRICSEARFCNRDLHEWLFSSLRYTPREVARGDGLDLRSLGLPPGGKHMLSFISDWKRLARLNRFGAYKLLALSEVGLISAAPALLCVVGRNDQRSVIDAGRLMTRVWTELNAEGIAVHPYYVVSDQINRLHDGTLAPGFDAKIAGAERDMRALLGLQENETLHMILRIGYPKAQPVRSRRLPLEAVFGDARAQAQGAPRRAD